MAHRNARSCGSFWKFRRRHAKKDFGFQPDNRQGCASPETERHFVKDNESKLQQPIDRDAMADIFAEIAIEAAVAVMAVYAADSHARRKPDGSPVCDADEAAEAIILERLGERAAGFAGACRGSGVERRRLGSASRRSSWSIRSMGRANF